MFQLSWWEIVYLVICFLKEIETNLWNKGYLDNLLGFQCLSVLGKNFRINSVVSMRSFNSWGSCMYNVSGPLFLSFSQSHYPVNLSSYLKDLLCQGVLVEASHMDHVRVEMAYVVSWGLSCELDLLVDVVVLMV